VPGFDALTIGRAQLWSFGARRRSDRITVNAFHASLTHNANNVGVRAGRQGRQPRVAGIYHRSRHAWDRRPRAAVRRRREPRIQHVHHGRDDYGRQSDGDTLHLATASRGVWGAHTVKFGGQYQFQQVRFGANATFNGTFTFAGTETGSTRRLRDCASNYIRRRGVFYLRNQYGARVRSVFRPANVNVPLNVAFGSNAPAGTDTAAELYGVRPPHSRDAVRQVERVARLIDARNRHAHGERVEYEVLDAFELRREDDDPRRAETGVIPATRG